jgi:fatty-acyl-CoA synthase
VNINPNYQSEELAYTLEKVGVKVLFINDKFKSLDYIKVVKKIVPDIQNQDPYHIKSARLPELRSVVRINEKND